MTLDEELKRVQERMSECIERANGLQEKNGSNNSTLKEVMAEYRELRGREEWLKESIKKRDITAKKIRNQSNLGIRFKKRTFDTFEQDKQPRAFKVCKWYADNFLEVRSKDKNSIVLMGSCGTGKTHLVASITNSVIDSFGIQVCFATWSEHLERLKAEYNTKKSDYLEIMKNVELLVIDDYGQEKRSEWTDEILFSVVNARYEKCLPILMTTNLNNLTGRMRESVQSRLLEMAAIERVDGKDYRS